MSEIKKITRRQKEVIRDLNNGAVLITDSSSPGAAVAFEKSEYWIGNYLFFNMVENGIIAQELDWPFNYKLTRDFKL